MESIKVKEVFFYVAQQLLPLPGRNHLIIASQHVEHRVESMDQMDCRDCYLNQNPIARVGPQTSNLALVEVSKISQPKMLGRFDHLA